RGGRSPNELIRKAAVALAVGRELTRQLGDLARDVDELLAPDVAQLLAPARVALARRVAHLASPRPLRNARNARLNRSIRLTGSGNLPERLARGDATHTSSAGRSSMLRRFFAR